MATQELSPKQVEALYAAMRAAGIPSIRALALQAGVSRQHLSDLVNRNSGAQLDFLRKVADTVHLPLEALLPGADPATVVRVGGLRLISERTRTVPTLGRSAADTSGGGWEEAYTYVPLPEDDKQQLSRWEVSGECMTGVIDAGDHVIVAMGAVPMPGDIVLARLLDGGDVILKRWFKSNGTYRFAPEHGEPFEVDAERVAILGVVLERIQRIKRTGL